MQINEAIIILNFEIVKDALRSIANYNCTKIEWCHQCELNCTGKCISNIASDILEFLEVDKNENK